MNNFTETDKQVSHVQNLEVKCFKEVVHSCYLTWPTQQTLASRAQTGSNLHLTSIKFVMDMMRRLNVHTQIRLKTTCNAYPLRGPSCSKSNLSFTPFFSFPLCLHASGQQKGTLFHCKGQQTNNSSEFRIESRGKQSSSAET